MSDREEKKAVCTICGKAHPVSELSEFCGKQLCPICLNAYTFVCACCRKRVAYSEIATWDDDDVQLCQDCLTDCLPAVTPAVCCSVRLTGNRMYGGELNINLGPDENKVIMTRGLTAYRLIDMFNKYRAVGISYALDQTFTSVDDFPDSEDILAWCHDRVLADIATGRVIVPDINASVQAIAKNYILRAYQLGLFNGVDETGTFAPYETLTRAQLCQLLYNMDWTTVDYMF